MNVPSRKMLYVALVIAAALIIGLAVRRFTRPVAPAVRSLRPSLTRVTAVKHDQQAVDPFRNEAPATTTVTNRSLTVREFRRSLLQIASLKRSRQRMDAVFELGKRLGAQDLDSALALAARLPEEWPRSVLYSGIFYSRGRELGRAAVEEFKGDEQQKKKKKYNLPGFNDAFAAGGAIAGWASVDPQAAIKWADAENESGFKRLARGVWGLRDVDALLAYAQAFPPGVMDSPDQADFLAWAKLDPDRAVEYTMTLPEEMRTPVLERIVHGAVTGWTEPYATDFTSLLLVAVVDDADDFLNRSIYEWWSRYDPARAADDVARSIDDEDWRRRVCLAQVLGNWMETNPVGALDWMKRNATSPEQERELLKQVFNHFGEVNPELVAHIIDDVPVIAGGSDFRDGLFSKWVEWEPRASYDWLAKKNVDHATLLDATADVALNLGRQDPDEALEWARTLTDPTLQPVALSGIALAQGFTGESSSAAAWITELPPGPTRYNCIVAYINGILQRDAGKHSPTPPDTTDLSLLSTAVEKSKLSVSEKQRLQQLIHGRP